MRTEMVSCVGRRFPTACGTVWRTSTRMAVSPFPRRRWRPCLPVSEAEVDVEAVVKVAVVKVAVVKVAVAAAEKAARIAEVVAIVRSARNRDAGLPF